MGKKPDFMLYNEWEKPMMSLPAPALKEFLRGMFRYNSAGEEPQFEDAALLPLWELMRSRLDRDTERYERVSEQRRNAVNARWERARQDVEESEPQEPLRPKVDKKLERYMHW